MGGLDDIVDSLREVGTIPLSFFLCLARLLSARDSLHPSQTVIYPLVYPQLYNSSSGLLQAPKGVLLHGPPGCGKTMLAKALAKESGAAFVRPSIAASLPSHCTQLSLSLALRQINVPLSSLANKWYGESNKLIAGLFTLARKMQPTIVSDPRPLPDVINPESRSLTAFLHAQIFIDEIDSLLRNRGSDNHEVTSTIKAEFLTCVQSLAFALSLPWQQPRLALILR